ncbi:MAG: hypothetical protein U5N86_00055 [Planctomycetota bacterium]|nr:hypothetical protein [Planctomycetota bacterium]
MIMRTVLAALLVGLFFISSGCLSCNGSERNCNCDRKGAECESHEDCEGQQTHKRNRKHEGCRENHKADCENGQRRHHKGKDGNLGAEGSEFNVPEGGHCDGEKCHLPEAPE